MKQPSKGLIKVIFVAAFTFAVLGRAGAQFNINPAGPGTGGSGLFANGQPASSAPTVPFDGGLSIMLAVSGIGYCSKKLKGTSVL